MGVRNLFDLSGKVALVTGGSRGRPAVGRSAGRKNGRASPSPRKQDEWTRRSHLTGLARMSHGGRDLARLATIPAMVDVDAAGFSGHSGQQCGHQNAAPAGDLSDDAWRKVMNSMSTPTLLSREVGGGAPWSRRSGGSSTSRRLPYPAIRRREMTTIAYNANKGALVNMTRAGEWAYNINVNPSSGFFPSKMTSVFPIANRAVLDLTPLGRLGGDEDLKGSVVFLASEASRHVTGHTLPVDGGYTII